MNLEIDGNAYIVSGSSRGIGKGIAGSLLAEGAAVMLTGRDESSLAATHAAFAAAHAGRVAAVAGDLTEAATLAAVEEAALAAFGKVDGVVANAGAVRPTGDWDIAPADWEWYFRANFDVAVRFVTRFIPQLQRTRGTVTIISSIAGIEEIGAPLPYEASKAALTMYAKGLANRLGCDGVRVNVVAPGNVIFPDGNWAGKQAANPEGVAAMLKEKVALARFGEPREIGDLVAFLASPRAGFVTGSCIVADGGQVSLFI
jgi:3-oxoacyl-[acyl-carrier protein] reductase